MQILKSCRGYKKGQRIPSELQRSVPWRTSGTPREWCDASADPPSASSAKADPGLSFLVGLYGVIHGARVMILGE